MGERRQPRGNDDVLGLEFLRVSEVIAQLPDVGREAVGFAAKSDSERGEAPAVDDEDVGLVRNLEVVEERTIGTAALTFLARINSAPSATD